MIKKIFLILIFCIPNPLTAMILRFVPSDGIGDFGILGKANEGDKHAHRCFMQNLAPLVLVADDYKKQDELNRILKYIVSYQTELKIKASNLPADANQVSIAILANSYHHLFEQLREIAVIYSARGTYVAPNHATFSNVMGCVLSCALEGAVNSRKPIIEKLEADLKKAKEDEDRWAHYWSEEKVVLEKVKKDSLEAIAKIKLDLDAALKNNDRKDKMLIECAYAISDLEDANKSLKSQSAQQDKAALAVAKEVIELEERNEALQEERDRVQKEKGALIDHFNKEVESIGTSATQKYAQAGNALATLRAEISQELSTLRRQVATQEVEIEKKDAEIARLKQAVAGRSLKKNKPLRVDKIQQKLKALQRATKK